MQIDKKVQMPIKCVRCRCNSFMNSLTVRKLDDTYYLLKGNCIVCSTKYNLKIDEPGYRELKIQIVLDSEE
jgi:hypothetical protein